MKTVALRSRAGFSLVEVALALGVAAFCLVPLFGLLPIGVNTNHASFEQTSAVNVASAVVADLRATALLTPPVNQNSACYGIPIPATPPGSVALFVRQDGTLSGTVNQDANPAQLPRFRVSLYFSSSAANNANNATAVRVLITWPALADARVSASPSQFTGSFETFTALVRN